jgi:hypothetical protein
MKTWKTMLKLAAGIALCWLTGCVVPCLYPLFEDKDLILEPTIVGTWEKMNGDRRTQETLQFTEVKNDDDNHYSILNTDKDGKKATLWGCLGKIDGKEYFCGTIDTEALPETTVWFVGIPRHFLIFRVEQIRPELRLTMLDYEACAKLLKEKPEAVAHVKILDKKADKKEAEDDKGATYILTAPPAELQKFIKDYGDKAKLFNPEKAIVFVPPEEAAKREAARAAEEVKAAAAEVARRMAERLKKYDLDGDGKLNAEEEKRAIEQEKAEQKRAIEQAKKQILAPPMDE